VGGAAHAALVLSTGWEENFIIEGSTQGRFCLGSFRLQHRVADGLSLTEPVSGIYLSSVENNANGASITSTFVLLGR
jgi:hypothetical protein